MPPLAISRLLWVSAFLALAFGARADPEPSELRERLELRLNGLSKHLDPGGDDLDETNYGLGCAYRWRAVGSRFALLDGAELHFEADVYEDSLSQFGYLFGVSARKPVSDWLDAGLFAGLIHERNLEEKYGLYLHPIAYPFVQTRFDSRVNARLSFVPPVRNGGLLALQLVVAFD